MIEFKVTMSVTSADLREMLERAEYIEQMAEVGDNIVIRDWYCDNRVTVHLTVDQERAKKKGLMK